MSPDVQPITKPKKKRQTRTPMQKADEVFVLDKADNPHPRMLDGALRARRSTCDQGDNESFAYWAGYLDAMADATGCDKAELIVWLDAHEKRCDDPGCS